MLPNLNRTHKYIAPLFFADLINTKAEKLFSNRTVITKPRYYLHAERRDVIICVTEILKNEQFDSYMRELRNDPSYVLDKIVGTDPLKAMVVLKIPKWINLDNFVKGKYSKISGIKVQKNWFPENFMHSYRVLTRDKTLIAEIAKNLDVDPEIIGELDDIPRIEDELFNHQPTPTPWF